MKYWLPRHYGLVLLAGTAVSNAFTLNLPSLPTAPTIPSRTVALTAPADGVTDDTAAINAAISALSTQGGGTLQFGDGTYLVTVNPNASDVVLSIQNNVRLAGASDGGTIIQLADAQPAYNTLIGNCCSIHDVDIENITIDMNGQNNLITSLDDKLAGPRNAVRVGEGERARVAGCTFVNVDDVNTLNFNGGTVSDIEAANNSFTVGMPAGTYDFDHSTIYTHARRIWIHDNTMTAANGPGTPVARTAVEIHGDDMTVENNTIDGYSIGVIITGQAVSSNRQLYQNNVFKNIMSGLEITSQQWPNATNEYGLQNITIANNQFAMSPFVWRTMPLIESSQPSIAIFVNPNPTNPAPINGLSITGNQITFPTGGTPSSGDGVSGGVVFWNYNGSMTPIMNAVVSGNTITNALGPAIWSNMTLTGGSVISSNTITNAAQSSGWGVEKAGIYVSGTTANMKVETNIVSDTAAKPVIKVGVDVISSCNAQCMSSGNTVTPASVTRSVLGPGWVH